MKRAFTLVEILVLAAVLLILTAILYPVFYGPRYSHGRDSCQSNLKQIGLGFLQYVQDYDTRFPPARITVTTGWKDAIFPYTKSEQLYSCPSASTTTTTPPGTDYFYNRLMARVNQVTMNEPAYTVLAGDGAENQPTWNSIVQLPVGWSADENAPSRRHLDRAKYLFADGHVRAYKPSEIAGASTQTGNPTFVVR